MSSRKIYISLGTHEAHYRRPALEKLATALGYGSVSELLQVLADAADYDLQQAANFWNDIHLLRCEALAVNGERVWPGKS